MDNTPWKPNTTLTPASGHPPLARSKTCWVRPTGCNWSELPAVRRETRKRIYIKKKTYGAKRNRITSVAYCCVVYQHQKASHGERGKAAWERRAVRGEPGWIERVLLADRVRRGGPGVFARFQGFPRWCHRGGRGGGRKEGRTGALGKVTSLSWRDQSLRETSFGSFPEIPLQTPSGRIH